MFPGRAASYYLVLPRNSGVIGETRRFEAPKERVRLLWVPWKDIVNITD
jgi:hypothetical protein